MAIELFDNIKTNAPKPTDNRYAPDGVVYTSIGAANAFLVPTIRYPGLTVNINNDEYWYKDGLTDTDLILKTMGGGGPGHPEVTIGTGNGLSIVSATQVLSLALATSTSTGALSNTDWNTFNNKQNALTNPVTGTGTAGTVPKFTSTTGIGNSNITDTGALITLGSDVVSSGYSTATGFKVPSGTGNVLLDNGNTAAVATLIGGLFRQEFVWNTGPQDFILSSNYTQVYSVEVQGQGALRLSQYTLTAPNKVTIIDTLNSGDYVVIIYSSGATGSSPYYTQAQVDALLANKVDKPANIKTISATSYTLLATDYNFQLFFTANTAITLTVPPGLTNFYSFEILQLGAGIINIVGGSGVTLKMLDYELPSTYGVNARVAINYIDVNIYELIGQLAML